MCASERERERERKEFKFILPCCSTNLGLLMPRSISAYFKMGENALGEKYHDAHFAKAAHP